MGDDPFHPRHQIVDFIYLGQQAVLIALLGRAFCQPNALPDRPKRLVQFMLMPADRLPKAAILPACTSSLWVGAGRGWPDRLVDGILKRIHSEGQLSNFIVSGR